MSFLKSLAIAAALAVSALAAPAAQAATLYLDKATMESPRTVRISGIGTAAAAPVLFDTNYAGERKDLLAWCVDVYHAISIKDYAPDLEYIDTNELTNDFAPTPHALDIGDAEKVGLLANYGQLLYDTVPVEPAAFTTPKPRRWNYPPTAAGTTAYNNALAAWNAANAAHTAAVNAYNLAVATRYTRLSAVQSAIWQVVSNRNVTSYTTDLAFDQLVDNLSGDHLTDFFLGDNDGTFDSGFKLITPVARYDYRHRLLDPTQSFVYAARNAVPEPAAWSLMIMGFGAVGCAIRRRRYALAA